ncbi:MAG: thiamine pyrophosphate-binding protein, partial [Dehalococcoidia bacterium]
MPKMHGYQYIAEFFKGTGTTHLFLMPANLWRTLIELEGSSITPVLAHSEKSAAYMADGYAKASGRPGIVITQGGPGATNLAAGLADAYQACSPVIALTEADPPSVVRTNSYQEVVAHFEDVTKYTAEVGTIDRLPDMLAQAFREATAGAPGPVHLAIQRPAELGEADLPEPFVDQRFTHYPAFRLEPEPAAVQEAARLLNEAERPVIIAGGGAMASGAWDEVRQLAEMLSIPVATSLSGKGVIPENHPLALGLTGLYSRGCTTRVVRSADLVLFVGVHGGSQVTNNFTAPRPGTPVIHIDINPAQIGKNYPVRVGLAGDARTTVGRLVEALEAVPDKAPKTEWANEAHQRVREWLGEWEPWLSSDAVPIRDERLCRELTEFLPRDALVVSDTGYSGAWAGAFLEMRSAGKNFIRCEGSLGWAFPAAMGVKCALPDRPVVCWTGDGGLYYHLTELETALRYGINTVTIVRNNGALLQEAHSLEIRYGAEKYHVPQFRPMNFAQVAQAMGAFGVRAEKPSEIRGALEKAVAAGRPALRPRAVLHARLAEPLTVPVFAWLALPLGLGVETRRSLS